jgi:hypothetical protein
MNSIIEEIIMETTAQVEKLGTEDTAETSEQMDTTEERTTNETGTFTRETISEFSSNIQLVDSNSELDLFCYSSCDRTSPDIVKQCRGVVFSKDTLVMKAFPYTLEFSENEETEISSKFSDWSKWSFYEAHEGTLLRMFYFGDNWYLSTHRKLNAFESKWSSSKSFGQLFTDALTYLYNNDALFKNMMFANADGVENPDVFELFKKQLNKTQQYMFLVSNSVENRIVCQAPPHPTVFHVGTFFNNQLVSSENNFFVGIPFSQQIYFKNVNDMLSFVRNVNIKSYQGVIGFSQDNEQVKVLNNEYQRLFEFRANEPSLKFRYLQLRKDENMVKTFVELYPNMVETINQYESIIHDVAIFIYNAYIQRFIKKLYVTVPKEEFAVIRECHSIYLADRAKNISLTRVVSVLNNQPVVNLNHMIKRFKFEQSKRNRQVQLENTPPTEVVDM